MVLFVNICTLETRSEQAASSRSALGTQLLYHTPDIHAHNYTHMLSLSPHFTTWMDADCVFNSFYLWVTFFVAERDHGQRQSKGELTRSKCLSVARVKSFSLFTYDKFVAQLSARLQYRYLDRRRHPTSLQRFISAGLSPSLSPFRSRPNIHSKTCWLSRRSHAAAARPEGSPCRLRER